MKRSSPKNGRRRPPFGNRLRFCDGYKPDFVPGISRFRRTAIYLAPFSCESGTPAEAGATITRRLAGLRRSGQAIHPPVLSCTAGGLSCTGDRSRGRWALTPPFHPCPPAGGIVKSEGERGNPFSLSLSLITPPEGGLFSVTLSVAGEFPLQLPRFRRARCLAVSGLSSQISCEIQAAVRHRFLGYPRRTEHSTGKRDGNRGGELNH